MAFADTARLIASLELQDKFSKPVAAVDQSLTKLDKKVSTLGRLGGAIDKVLTPGAFLVGFGGGLAATKALDFLGDSVEAASNLNETLSATGQIFGEQATPALEEWAETASDAFGQSKRQALDAANTFATFGKSAGLAGTDLTTFSQDLTVLASDLASFRNTSPEEAIQAIGAALRGESEPIRRYGVLLDEATLRQRALTLGIVDNIKTALTPQQRVLAAQAEIMAQTADAQGDFARTSDGLANSQRILAAELEDAQAKLGEALLPIILELVQGVTSLIDVFDDLGGVLDTLNTPFKAVETSLSDVGDMARDVGLEIDPKEWAFAIHDFVDEGVRDLFDMGTALHELEKDTTGMTATWAAAWGEAADTVKTEGGFIVSATEDTADDVVDAALEGADLAAAEFGLIPEKSAQEILDNEFHIKDAMAELLLVMEQALTPAQEIAGIIGFLTSQRLARGLDSNKPAVRAAAEELRDAAIARLNELEALGYTAGSKIPPALAAGMDSTSWQATQAAARLAAGVAGFLPVNSPPENPQSALANIYSAGDNIVDAITRGILGGLDEAEAASLALSNALAPKVRPTVLAGRRGGVVGGGPSALTVKVSTQISSSDVKRNLVTHEFATDWRGTSSAT